MAKSHMEAASVSELAHKRPPTKDQHFTAARVQWVIYVGFSTYHAVRVYSEAGVTITNMENSLKIVIPGILKCCAICNRYLEQETPTYP